MNLIKKISIERMKNSQIDKVAKIASECFFGLRDTEKARKWITCNFNAFPRMQYFVARLEKEILGYILWVEKGGFRDEAVIELEQIGVAPRYRGMGIGTKLIEESFKKIKQFLEKRGSTLKLIIVTTGTDNETQKLYERTLGAKPECVIKDLFRGDEVVMIARFKQKD